MQISIENKPDPNKLLDWYDCNAREMPWRIAPKNRLAGTQPNPYHVWLSEIMLQQTTVASVKPYFTKFTKKWPTIFDLANAKDDEVMGAWAGLGYYARARNLLKCARLIAKNKSGKFPEEMEALLKLPGIGPYTASAISSIAYDNPETVVDGNVERVISRIFNVHTELPKAKKELSVLAKQLTPKLRSGDYAQAIMDLGATICKPKIPNCDICPWVNHCISKRAGTSVYLPRKIKKANTLWYRLFC
jgi:A/G-specific adenine glycosylase